MFSNIHLACANMGVLEGGIEIHLRVVDNGFTSHVEIENALIAMYTKNGEIHKIW